MYTYLLQNGALWEMRLVHCGICELGQLWSGSLMQVYMGYHGNIHLCHGWDTFVMQRTYAISCCDNQSGLWFYIKMPPYQCRESHCEDKTVVRSSYVYWIRAPFVLVYTRGVTACSLYKQAHEFALLTIRKLVYLRTGIKINFQMAIQILGTTDTYSKTTLLCCSYISCFWWYIPLLWRHNDSDGVK